MSTSPQTHADATLRSVAYGFAATIIERVLEADRAAAFTFNEIDPLDFIVAGLVPSL